MSGAVDDLGAALARSLNTSKDVGVDLASRLDDSTIGAILADQPSRAFAAGAEETGSTVRSLGYAGAATGIGTVGVYQGGKYFQQKQQLKNRQQSRDLIRDIANDPQLSGEQKKAAIEDIVNSGATENLGNSGGSGGGKNPLSGLFEMFGGNIAGTVAGILVLYFGGKFLLAAMDNLGGSGGGGGGGGASTGGGGSGGGTTVVNT